MDSPPARALLQTLSSVPTFRALCAESSYGDHPLDAVHKARHVGVRGEVCNNAVCTENDRTLRILYEQG
jgi:hypothetical protein